LQGSWRAGCLHPFPEHFNPSYGLVEFDFFCRAPEPIHFMRIDPPCVAIPNISRSGEWHIQSSRSAADGSFY
jgi:hypothetical protein